MHYTGMAALQINADIIYDRTLVTVSVLIAVAAATTALWLASNLNSNWARTHSAPSWAPPCAVCTTPPWQQSISTARPPTPRARSPA